MGAGGDRRSRQQAKVSKLESRDNYSQNWQTPLMKTCPSSPGFFCFAMWCPWCASYSNRKKALHDDMSRYICCNGDCPCSGRMKEQECPEFCLCMETCCCFAQSVASTRWLLQDRLAIRNTKCDNCIIGTMVCLQYLDCVCSIAACLTDNEFIDQAAECVDCAADITWCTVCACMQTQARYEMNENPRWGGGHGGGAYTSAPPQQHMAYPGGGGHGKHSHPPPPQAMQHPGGGAPPPPGYPAAAQGYGPPPGYPRT